jgi:hypothetical protein
VIGQPSRPILKGVSCGQSGKEGNSDEESEESEASGDREVPRKKVRRRNYFGYEMAGRCTKFRIESQNVLVQALEGSDVSAVRAYFERLAPRFRVVDSDCENNAVFRWVERSSLEDYRSFVYKR